MRKFLIFSLATILCFVISKINPVIAALESTVIINELMPNPAGVDSDFEWVELYNPTEINIDLTGYKLDGQTFQSSTIINAKSFLIVAKNKDALLTRFPNILNVVSLNFSLTNTSDTLNLTNSANELIDSINYTSVSEDRSLERKGNLVQKEGCTDLIQNGEGNSIEKENLNLDPNCVFEEVVEEPEEPEEPPVEFNDTTITEILFSTDNTNFSNSIDALSDQEVFLQYSLSKDIFDIASETYKLEDGSIITSPFSIKQYLNQKVTVEIEFVDGTKISKISEPINIFPKLRINEVYSSDDELNLDWVEIYNLNEFSVNLSDYYLNNSDNPILVKNTESSSEITNTCNLTLELLPQSYCVVLFPNKLNQNESLELGINDLVIQDLIFTTLEPGQSLSFYNNEFTTDFTPSPAVENKPLNSSIIFTEVYPSPSTGEKEWLEIYNEGKYQINLDGWYFSETIENNICVGSANSIFENKIINSKEFFLIESPSLGVSLNNTGDEIYLCDSEGKLISEVLYTQTEKGVSYSRKLESENIFTDGFQFTNSKSPNNYSLFQVEPEDSDPEPEEPEHEEVNTTPINLSADLNLLVGKLVYLEGEIVDNFGSSFDVETDFGIIRVGISNIEKPERSKGDYAKVTGTFDFSNDLYRIYPRNISDIQIIKAQVPVVIKAAKSSTATTAKKSSATTVATKSASPVNSASKSKNVLGSEMSLAKINYRMPETKINEHVELEQRTRFFNSPIVFFGLALLILIIVLLKQRDLLFELIEKIKNLRVKLPVIESETRYFEGRRVK